MLTVVGTTENRERHGLSVAEIGFRISENP